MNFFTDLALPTMKVEFGGDFLEFLEASSLAGIFPYELIDAFFSSESFLRLEDGKLPGMRPGKAKSDDFHCLLRYDNTIEAFCPDYHGARLADEVRVLSAS